MMKVCEIEVKGEMIEARKEALVHGTGAAASITRYGFYRAGVYIGGYTITTYDPAYSLLGERIAWQLTEGKKGKYNRYFLTKMARLADEKLKEGK